MIASYDVPKPSYMSLSITIDENQYSLFDDGGYPAWHNLELASKYPDKFTKLKTINKDHEVAVLRIAQELFEAHGRHFNQTVAHDIETDLNKGGMRKAFMVWATGDINAEIPRIPRPWDYKLQIKMPRLVRKN